MKIVTGYPPNYKEIEKAFNPTERYVFTYGDTIFAPQVTPDDVLISHEEIHARQQQKHLTPAEWWSRYIKDPEFRTQQELEAYRVQYKFYCKKYKSREQRFKFLRFIAGDLSSATYGNVMTFSEAYQAISEG